MRRIFGAAKPVVAGPTLDETVATLDLRGARSDGQIEKLDAQLVKFKEQISRTRPGPAQDAIKRRALQILKQKRMHEGQRDQMYQQQANLEQTKFTLDSIKDTVQTVKGMTAMNAEMQKALKKNKELNLDYIDKVQDSMFDMMDMTNEINEAMSRSYGVPDDVDESDLMAELDALEGEYSLNESAVGTVPSYLQEPEEQHEVAMPSAPGAARPMAYGMPTAPAQRI